MQWVLFLLVKLSELKETSNKYTMYIILHWSQNYHWKNIAWSISSLQLSNLGEPVPRV